MSEPIHSPQNPRIKQTVRLREASHRRSSGLMLIDGAREIAQAILGGIEIQELFVDENCESWQDAFGTMAQELPAQASSNLDRVGTLVSKQVLEKLAYGNRNESLVAIAKQPSVELERLKDHERSVVLVIDQVEKPGNIGAMLRTASAIGATAVLLSDPVCDLWNSNAIRASLGAIFRMPIAIAPASNVVAWLEDRQYQIVAARVDGSQSYRPFQWSAKTSIVVGSEAKGLGKVWHQSKIVGMRLPMHTTVDSLNVSVTAAILMYEATSANST
ncbi:MAG: TrmH family RNA methyltransferase [Pirellulaceae bacterium]|nr:TrmH family RNA methyltransferase [Pirellulaceae bacterium]